MIEWQPRATLPLFSWSPDQTSQAQESADIQDYVIAFMCLEELKQEKMLDLQF
jgi:hypothetical protein